MAERELVRSFRREEFEVSAFRGSGPGGQHRNKTDSCIRIKHIESGLTVEACESRSQHVNKGVAFRRLAAKVVEHYFPKRQKERAASGNEVIRTYHAVDNRVKDGASGLTQPYQAVLDNPSAMIEARAAALARGDAPTRSTGR